MAIITRAEYYIPDTKGGIIRSLVNLFQMKRCDLLPMKYDRLRAIYRSKMDDKLHDIKKRLIRELSCL